MARHLLKTVHSGECKMNYWRGQPINCLTYSEARQAANEAIAELMGLREDRQKNENFQMLTLSFILGACFSAVAIAFGVLLH
jgi:hypothetical protein